MNVKIGKEQIKEGILPYDRWLEKYGKEYREKSDNDMQKFLNDAEIAGGRRGNGAEKLYSTGLASSGYADYIRDSARNSIYDYERLSGRELEKNTADGYEDYITTLGSKIDALKNRAENKLNSYTGYDTESAYSYALSYGLSDSDARDVAGRVSKVNKSSQASKAKVLAKMIDESYEYDIAYKYALACGFTDDEARKMARVSEASREKKYDYGMIRIL